MTLPGASASWLQHDSEEMLAATAALPDHIEAAMRSFSGIGAQRERISAVLVLGMGGSAVAGAVVQALASSRSTVPVVLASGYACPAFVGPDTLVFAVSFSGETEETLEATAAALRAGAHVVALTQGGSLEQLVAASGGPVLYIPPGIPQPRAGVGAMVAPLLLACQQAGVVPGARSDLEHSVAQLRRRVPSLVDGGGEAEEVARRIGRTIPLVHGATGLAAVAARRWKTQVNENAKAPAFCGEQPEVCHNEVCGFGQNGDVTRQILTLVELHLPGEHPQVARRFELVAEAVAEAVGDVVSVLGVGEGELAGFFDLVAIGDFMSLHLAGREGVDPGPVPVLTDIKQRLRTGAEA
ncbi:MAG: SIS domain-containing protein [Acidimicrobiales bacterium]